ncbi:hypothetical protein HDV01_005731 [Terramyces sp. JEL0728]|nr:hypothetical protein HDV01_005731 [Terramyces sp. JEL0728]
MEIVNSIDSQKEVSNFMILFRMVLPDLYSHFQEEEINTREWVLPWFETLLAKQLPIENVLRLWDRLICMNDIFYVCLAIFVHCKEELEELEQSEIHAFLHRLPLLNMDIVLSLANEIKQDYNISEYI